MFVTVEELGGGRFAMRVLAMGRNGARAADQYFRIVQRVLRVVEGEREYSEVDGEILAAVEEGRTMLDLDGRELTELPVEIGLAKKLEALSVTGNRLERLPASLGLLTELQELYVGENRLKELPREIGLLRNLKTLVASDNMLTQIPATVRHLGKLRWLELERNQLMELPADIGCLKGLRRLWLARNRLKWLPPQLGRLTELQDWDFSQKRLPPRFPWALTLQGNPLEDFPEKIPGAGEVLAHLRSKIRAEWDGLVMEGSTEAEFRDALDWCGKQAGWEVHELVGGPFGLTGVVQTETQRVMLRLDWIGVLWVGWVAERWEKVRELVEGLRSRLPFAEGFGDRTTRELIELAATGRYGLKEEWGTVVFYGSRRDGGRVMWMEGTEGLALEVFHETPKAGETRGFPGGMSCGEMTWQGLPVRCELGLWNEVAANPEMVVVAGKGRLVRRGGGWDVEMEGRREVKGLWFAAD